MAVRKPYLKKKESDRDQKKVKGKEQGKERGHKHRLLLMELTKMQKKLWHKSRQRQDLPVQGEYGARKDLQHRRLCMKSQLNYIDWKKAQKNSASQQNGRPSTMLRKKHENS
jgi:hypothetical protein